MPLTKDQHFNDTKIPKRILSLDRGRHASHLSAQVLDAIEEMLRARTGRPNLVLADSST